LYSAHVCGALDVPFERVDFDFSRTGSDMIESSTCSKIVRRVEYKNFFCPKSERKVAKPYKLVTVFLRPCGNFARNAKGE
tara:strand:- start:1643 stop:1882 length:240 start_codon:yes stop_codon:yes gene_type:complete